MKNFIVEPFPYEHIYSWLLRMYKLSGCATFLDYQKTIGINDRFLHANKVFSSTAETLVNLFEHRADAIKYHTTAPLWLLSVGRILNNESVRLDSFTHMNEEQVFTFDTYWHSCKECRNHDQKAYGTTYWHAPHQLTSIFICYKHHCLLEKAEEPVRNLFEEMLPHDVENWIPMVLAPDNDMRDWQSFYLYMNELSKNQPDTILTIKTRLFEILELKSKAMYKIKEKGNLQNQRFQSELSTSLLRYLFRRYHSTVNGKNELNIVNISLIDPYEHHGERHPIFLVVLAYWQRAALNL